MNVSRRMVLGSVCVVMLGLAALLWAQNGESFLPPAIPSTGTIVFTFNITVISTLPKNAVIGCRGSASVNEAGQNIQQDAHGIATLSNGKWTCKATMPYSWALATPASDTINLNYDVDINYGFLLTATTGTGTVVVPLTVDKVSQNLKPISPVPANGSITQEPINATI